MTPDQATQLANISWLMSNSIAPAVGRIEQRTYRTEAQVTALTSALDAMARSSGLDPTTITTAINTAVDAALRDLTITLTTQEAK